MEAFEKLREFAELIARMTPEGECPNCHVDGDAANTDCEEHYPFEDQDDDSIQTLANLIASARKIMREVSSDQA